MRVMQSNLQENKPFFFQTEGRAPGAQVLDPTLFLIHCAWQKETFHYQPCNNISLATSAVTWDIVEVEITIPRIKCDEMKCIHFLLWILIMAVFWQITCKSLVKIINRYVVVLTKLFNSWYGTCLLFQHCLKRSLMIKII